ncbi:MAG: hypothetical protein LBR65_03810 [Culturomica sp.]|jgi:hypothetical protein|nr:hypothetical protein [Culturomica sp.]
MNEYKYKFTDGEMVADLRAFGLRVEERDIEKNSGQMVSLMRMWMVYNPGSRRWVPAVRVYTALLGEGFKRAALGGINRLDIINILKNNRL